MTPASPVPDYRGERLAFLTQHGKERLVATVLEPALGLRVERVEGFDTDTLGTFTRDIPRAGTQLEAARRKARLAIELSGAGLGLGSEGAFGPDPHAGLMPWNVELLVLVDGRSNLEVVGIAQGAAGNDHALLHDEGALLAFAAQVGFPGQRLVLRPDHEDHPRLWKGLGEEGALRAAWREALAASATGKVFAECDLRAHFNPSRQRMITRAAEDLLQKLRSACPDCGRPGFVVGEVKRGLPCAKCGLPTREPIAEIRVCAGCGAREERVLPATTANPGRCDHCNP